MGKNLVVNHVSRENAPLNTPRVTLHWFNENSTTGGKVHLERTSVHNSVNVATDLTRETSTSGGVRINKVERVVRLRNGNMDSPFGE